MQMAQAISNYCTHVARGCFEAAEKYSVTQKIMWSKQLLHSDSAAVCFCFHTTRAWCLTPQLHDSIS
jgi:hypothetical protein